MKRRDLLLAFGGVSGCARRSPPRLNVFNWSNYVAPDTVANFERKFGVRARYAIYESNEEMLARVMSGNSGWDIVFPSNYIVGPMREQGLLARIRHQSLRNLGNIGESFRAPQWDPRLEWSVPYMWSATGICYNRRLSPPPRRWADLWDPRLKGRVTMLDDPAEVFGACLRKLGYSPNSNDRSQLEAAKSEAIRQKTILRAYLNAEVRDQMVAGDVLAAQMWATIANQAMAATDQLGFVFPEEGFLLYLDSAVILRESRRQELAHAFIDYLLQPEVAAACASATRTATANGAALELLPPGIRANSTLYPDSFTLARGEWTETFPPAAQRLRDRLWTEIKSAP